MSEGFKGIKIDGLWKSFARREVIQDLHLKIDSGTFTAIVGPSGCGKSTLLRLMAGLESATTGSLQNTFQNQTGFVFQEANLLSWKSVLENILLPFELLPRFNDISRTEARTQALQALEKVKLQDAADLFPHQLSGGMKMRVALARALVTKPRLLLLDEPFAALDEFTRTELQNQLRELWLKEKMTVVFVTHSLSEALYLAERVIMLKGPGAKIVLDQKLSLPVIRTEVLKTSEEFNSLLRQLSERLRQ